MGYIENKKKHYWMDACEIPKEEWFCDPDAFRSLVDQLGASSSSATWLNSGVKIIGELSAPRWKKKNEPAKRLSVPCHVVFCHTAKERLLIHGYHVQLQCSHTLHHSIHLSPAPRGHGGTQSCITANHKPALFKYGGKDFFLFLKASAKRSNVLDYVLLSNRVSYYSTSL